ncbi:hypothetical protein BOX15_Mlig001622g3 [Macrostomum lignano]|uniref:Uncharacterized protein n=1 Tax=Macrostomum lignano TaxID=282301 RepID=A0A267GBZ9_9PLAT|nr:hypothetical protein BOX15_Mlig001622g3 [Macrostomum lignano]
MGNKSSKRAALKPATSVPNVCRGTADSGTNSKGVTLRRSKPPARPVTCVADRPASVQPRSTRHSDTRLIINQLCSKRPKYCLLKQLDFDQLDEQVQFLLFESVCDQLDQLGTIDRLRSAQAAQRPAMVKTKTSGNSLEQIVTDYRQLCSKFMAVAMPELLLLTGCQPEELYSSAHRILAEMLSETETLWHSKADSLTCSLLDCSSPSSSSSTNRSMVRQQVQQLLCSTSAEVAATIGWSSLLSANSLALLLSSESDRDQNPQSLGLATQRFLDAAAVWCWGAVCACHSSFSGQASSSLTVLVEDLVEGSGTTLKFDPRLHRTVVGAERAGARIGCVLWPALCHRVDPKQQDSNPCDATKLKPETILCKAMVKLC